MEGTCQEPPRKEVVMVHGFATWSYIQQWDKLHLMAGVLYRRWKSSNGLHVAEQLVVPSWLRRAIIQLTHEQVHFGVDRTAEQVRRRAYWVCCRRDVRVELGRCANCAQYYTGKSPRQAALKLQVNRTPWSRVSINITRTARGQRPGVSTS